MRYALIEDELPARLRMNRLLRELHPDARLLGEAEDGPAGLVLLKELGPELDLLFMDIEFPPGGAFQLLEEARQLGLSVPRLVFVTAYDRHAIEAFRWAACDYLLKPVERERLSETLRRLSPPPDLPQLQSALQASHAQTLPERFTVRSRDRLIVLTWDQVSHLTTENRLLFVHTPRGRFVLDRSMEELEHRLAPRFYRCHRSALVAVERIVELCPEAGGTGEVLLQDGSRVAVSRERLPGLRRQLEQ